MVIEHNVIVGSLTNLQEVSKTLTFPLYVGKSV